MPHCKHACYTSGVKGNEANNYNENNQRTNLSLVKPSSLLLQMELGWGILAHDKLAMPWHDHSR